MFKGTLLYLANRRPIQRLVMRHAEETGSEVAAGLLADWPAALRRITTVMPRDYKRVLAELDSATLVTAGS